MSHPSKRKGSDFEIKLEAYLQSCMLPAKRQPARGKLDEGDIHLGDLWVIEAKAEKSINLPGYLAELEVEMANAERPYGVVVVKRRNHQIGRSYVVMELDRFIHDIWMDRSEL